MTPLVLYGGNYITCKQTLIYNDILFKKFPVTDQANKPDKHTWKFMKKHDTRGVHAGHWLSACDVMQYTFITFYAAYFFQHQKQ